MSLYSNLYCRFCPRQIETGRIKNTQQHTEAIRMLLPPDSADCRRLASKTIVVVGAGFAGLSAALWLKRWGASRVIVLEARNRVGGRVRSDIGFTPARIIEAGAELIGLNHPLWLEFAREFGLGLSVITPEDYFSKAGLEEPISIGGALLTPKEQRFVFDEMTALTKQITQDAVFVNAREPWKSPDARALDSVSLGDRLAQLDISDLTRHMFTVMMENDNAMPVNRQSYLAILASVKGGGLADFWTESEIFRCETGNQSLAACMLNELRASGGSVLLNSPVTGIEIGDGHVSVGTKDMIYNADYSVLTVPPSVWHAISVMPRFPAALYPAQGPAIKYLCNIKSRFWIREGLAPTGFSDELGQTWEGTDNQMQLQNQGLEMSVYAGGSYAAAAMSAPDTRQYFTSRIRPLYSGFEENALTDCFLDWPRMPWSMTGFSCPHPGQVTTLGPVLASPYYGRLFFAGEYASPDFFGYMEGALQSGTLAALRIFDQAGKRS